MTLIYCKTALGLCQSSLTLGDVVRMQNDPIQTSPEDEERDLLSSVDFHLLLADSSARIFLHNNRIQSAQWIAMEAGDASEVEIVAQDVEEFFPNVHLFGMFF